MRLRKRSRSVEDVELMTQGEHLELHRRARPQATIARFGTLK
jgi:hypothetical protein